MSFFRTNMAGHPLTLYDVDNAVRLWGEEDNSLSTLAFAPDVYENLCHDAARYRADNTGIVDLTLRITSLKTRWGDFVVVEDPDLPEHCFDLR